MQFKGAYTALVTPFSGGEVDEQAYRDLIERQIQEGIDGLVPCGTTGESATLSHDEHERVITICIDQAKGRVPVIAGAGSNNTQEAVRLSKFAKEAGADGALHITPYYNKPPADGLIAHFKAITAESGGLPLIVYNVPGRTAQNVQADVVARLHKEVPDVVGIKEATGDMKQVAEVVEYCGPAFQVLSGDDFTVLPLLCVGGQGVISVISNIAPSLMSGMCNAFEKGDMDRAQKLHYQMAPLNRAMFMTTSPIPVKTALSLMGVCKAEFRLPLTPLAEEKVEELKSVLQAGGLL
jgi:4-hydroxy-tetrahydrodipicolinate synthase